MINFFRQPIEKKLSALLGTAVSIDDLDVSLLKGSAIARGVRVGGDDASQPLLTLRSIQFALSISRALQKQFEVKNLTLDQPSMRLVWQRNRQWNLPKLQQATKSEDEQASRWRFDLHKVLLVEGRIELCLELSDAADYTLVFEGVMGELTRDGQRLRFTVIARSLHCGGHLLPGEVRLAGMLSGVGEISDFSHAGLQAHLEIGNGGRATVTTDRLTSRRFGLMLDLSADARQLLELLPPVAALDSIRSLRISGPLRVSTELQIIL